MMWRFQTFGSKMVLCFDICGHENVGKGNCCFVLIAVPWGCTDTAFHKSGNNFLPGLIYM